MRARGFTLVEVMVALAIVAIALPALLVAMYRQVDDTGYLRDKSLAAMVAANQLAQMRLVVASTRSLTAGKDNGNVTMADREWYWWIETTAQPQEDLFRVQIDVALEETQRDQPLYTLTTFMTGDLREDNAAPAAPSDAGDPPDARDPTDPDNTGMPNNPGGPRLPGMPGAGLQNGGAAGEQ